MARAFRSRPRSGWRYTAAFRTGADIAISLDLAEGRPAAFDGAAGYSDVPHHRRAEWHQGMLRYAGTRESFLNDGGDSPEGFFDYAGFADTPTRAMPMPTRAATSSAIPPAGAGWRPGDPSRNRGKGIIAALMPGRPGSA